MDDFLRRQAARGLLYDKAGKLRERLTWNELLALWCPLDGTDASKARRLAVAAALNGAIKSAELKAEVEVRTEVVHAPHGGWAVPLGKTYSSDLDELHARTAPRTQEHRTTWISRDALRAWLALAGGWPTDEASPLRFWWPEEDAAQAAMTEKTSKAGRASGRSRREQRESPDALRNKLATEAVSLVGGKVSQRSAREKVLKKYAKEAAAAGITDGKLDHDMRPLMAARHENAGKNLN